MDPAIEHQDLRPPAAPRLSRGMLVAIVAVHLAVVAALMGSVESKRLASDAGQSPAPSSVVPRPSSAAQVRAESVAEPPGAARTACPSHPLLVAAGAKDGQSSAGTSGRDVDALLLAGKEAVAAAEPRNAEAAFLAACRLADATKGPGSVESAEARYQLARHYLAAAGGVAAPSAGPRARVLAEAEALYSDSLQRFRTRFGDSHEKTRFAAEGLQAVQLAQQHSPEPATPAQAVATATLGAGTEEATEPSASPPRPRAAAPARAAPAPAPAAAAATVRRAATPSAARGKQAVAQRAVSPAPMQRSSVRPSFDCGHARSFAERKICSDPELAQADRDLGRLYARAKRSAPDPRAFQRQSDAQWRRREQACRDRGCLLRWYAERRVQLTQALMRGPARPDHTAAR